MIPRTPHEKNFTQGYQRRPFAEGIFAVDTVISCISERAKKMPVHLHPDVCELLMNWKDERERKDGRIIRIDKWGRQ
jgi:hypothetical protein